VHVRVVLTVATVRVDDRDVATLERLALHLTRVVPQ
jgi:hypothetical protein